MFNVINQQTGYKWRTATFTPALWSCEFSIIDKSPPHRPLARFTDHTVLKHSAFKLRALRFISHVLTVEAKDPWMASNSLPGTK